jgi:hypothetical protein
VEKSREIRWRVAAYFMDGTGAFGIAVLFILLAGVSFSHAFHRQEAERATFHKLLATRSEPFRNEEYQVAASVLMLAISEQIADTKADFCDTPGLKDVYVQMLREFEKSLPKHGETAATLRTCEQSSKRVWQLGASDFHVRLPRPRSGDTCKTYSRVVAADWEKVFDLSRQAVELVSRERSFKTVYFVSRDGLLVSRGAAKVEEIPETHVMQGGSYARAVLAEDPAYVCKDAQMPQSYKTQPYLDVTGVGVVETVCTRMKVGDDLGAFCVDRAWDRSVITKALLRLEHAFTSHSVYYTKGESNSTFYACRRDCLAKPATGAIVGDLRKWIDEDPTARKSIVSRASQFTPDSEGANAPPYLIVPARLLNTLELGPTQEAIVLIPRRAAVIEVAYLSLGLLMLIIAGAVIFYSQARQRERARLTILNGLPIAVIVTRGSRAGYARIARRGLRPWLHISLSRMFGYLPSTDVFDEAPFDEILFANPAAESLLDQKLPRFPRASLVLKGIEPTHVFRFLDWLRGADEIDYRRESSSRDIARTSDYHVTLMRGRHRGRRVRIIGTWIRRANGDVDTFGVIWKVKEP